MLDVYINLWLSIGLYDEEPLEIETNSALSPPQPKKKKTKLNTFIVMHIHKIHAGEFFLQPFCLTPIFRQDKQTNHSLNIW
jgi:hypothetical protein